MNAKTLALGGIALALTLAFPAWAQEGFGFGEAASPAASASAAANAGESKPAAGLSALKTGGKLEYGMATFLPPSADTSLLGGATGRIDLEARGSSVDAVIKLKLNELTLSEHPADVLDEAYLRIYMGALSLEGGLLKISWGKADSQGPLDILNPFDFTDLTVTDTRERKLAQAMLHASLALGSYSKLEAVFIPGFTANRYAWEGAWTPKAISTQKAAAYGMFYHGEHPTANGGMGDGLYASYYSAAWSAAFSAAYAQYLAASLDAKTAGAMASSAATAAASANAGQIAAQADAAAAARVAGLLDYPDTKTLDYAQGGLRFTTSLGRVDLGLQYFYGFLPSPAASADPAKLAANGYRIPVAYNRYHQAGADFAAVILGFNLRAEAAANITSDLGGKDPDVYNPSAAWALGFDRDLFAGINLNLQYSGSYRLFDDGVGAAAYDIESGSDRTRTRVTAVVSQRLFKDALEWQVSGLYGIEDADFLVRPDISLIVGDSRLDLCAGLFGGNEDGEMGQFYKLDYLQLSFSYQF
jgi:hypothetical protein